MIEGGKGGALTKSGLHFEKRKDILKMLAQMDEYDVQDKVIYYKGERMARSIRKHDLYKYLKEEGVDWREIISKKLLPDEALLVYHEKTVYIIEMKFQKVEGSVDEKLQTCDFKKKQYQKLFQPLDLKVEYLYVLNDWFGDKRYKDTINYIDSVDCKYYFEDLPLQDIGLIKE